MEEKWMFLISEKIIKGIRPEIPDGCPKILRDLITAVSLRCSTLLMFDSRVHCSNMA